MNKKLISTLSVLALLIIILVAGGIYIFVVQQGDIKERQEKLDELSKNVYDPVELDDRYKGLQNNQRNWTQYWLTGNLTSLRIFLPSSFIISLTT